MGNRFAHFSPAWLLGIASLVLGFGVTFQGGVSAQDVSVPRFLDGDNSLSVRFPTSTNTANRLGWTIRLRMSDHRTADTMRVEMDFAATGGPTVADQSIEVRFTPIPGMHAPPQSSLRASIPLRIPEGTQQIRFARHLPKSSFGNYYLVELFEERRAIPNCKSDIGTGTVRPDSAVYENQAQQSKWRVLWVRSEADDATRVESMRMLELCYGPRPFYTAQSPEQWMTATANGISSNQTLQIQAVRAPDLPQDWLSYRSFDAITLHRDDWVSLAGNDSPHATAVRDFIHAGGTMIIRDADPDSDETQKTQRDATGYSIASSESINSALEMARKTLQQFDAFVDPNSDLFATETNYIDLSPEQKQQWREWFPGAAQQIRTSLDEYSFADARSQGGVRARDKLGGTIIFLGKNKGRPIEVLQWAAVSDLMSWRTHRLIRSGVEPILGSQRFFQWVIPGVSQPPVYTFMGLLGLFVILVGPVAYRKSAKAGRSYLMFAIAPVLAIATTVAMLGYGVIADGFGSQVRSRQITWVDGNTGDAFTRTRSTYFAGIRPSGGLVFPPDADVTIYPDNQTRSWESRIDERFESRGEVIASEDGLRFGRDFLPSRQQRQFVVHRPAHSWGRIRITPNPKARNIEDIPLKDITGPLLATDQDSRLGSSEPLTGPESILVQSETAAPLSELILCDENGDYYFADQLDGEANATARRITRAEASKMMGEMYKRQWLISNVSERRPNNNRNGNKEITDLLSEQLNEVGGPVKPTEGVFEYELQQRMQLQADLPKNSFLGLTELTEGSVAIPDAEVTASIHYVMGSLP